MSRGAVSKRTRFEVFKRDKFTCQYCGRTPPRVVLECDHVDPVAAGGSSDPANLIDRLLSVVPETVAARTARIAEAEEQYIAYRDLMRLVEARMEGEIWEVVGALFNDTSTTNARYLSIKMFLKRLPVHLVVEAAEIALAKNPWSDPKRFQYFCGVCWNFVREGGL